jgi:hypothetical protein
VRRVGWENAPGAADEVTKIFTVPETTPAKSDAFDAIVIERPTHPTHGHMSSSREGNLHSTSMGATAGSSGTHSHGRWTFPVTPMLLISETLIRIGIAPAYIGCSQYGHM